MHCTRCGAKLDDDAVFCAECGAPVAGDTVSTPEASDDAALTQKLEIKDDDKPSSPESVEHVPVKNAPAPVADESTQVDEAALTQKLGVMPDDDSDSRKTEKIDLRDTETLRKRQQTTPGIPTTEMAPNGKTELLGTTQVARNDDLEVRFTQKYQDYAFPEYTVTTIDTPTPKKKHRGLIVMIVILAILLVLGVAGYLVYRQYSVVPALADTQVTDDLSSLTLDQVTPVSDPYLPSGDLVQTSATIEQTSTSGDKLDTVLARLRRQPVTRTAKGTVVFADDWISESVPVDIIYQLSDDGTSWVKTGQTAGDPVITPEQGIDIDLVTANMDKILAAYDPSLSSTFSSPTYTIKGSTQTTAGGSIEYIVAQDAGSVVNMADVIIVNSWGDNTWSVSVDSLAQSQTDKYASLPSDVTGAIYFLACDPTSIPGFLSGKGYSFLSQSGYVGASGAVMDGIALYGSDGLLGDSALRGGAQPYYVSESFNTRSSAAPSAIRNLDAPSLASYCGLSGVTSKCSYNDGGSGQSWYNGSSASNKTRFSTCVGTMPINDKTYAWAVEDFASSSGNEYYASVQAYTIEDFENKYDCEPTDSDAAYILFTKNRTQ